jgi:hypothetical protein
VKQAMRNRVAQVRSGLRQKYTLNIGSDGYCENRIELFPHLLKERRYRSILLSLRRIIEYGYVMPMRLQHVT